MISYELLTQVAEKGVQELRRKRALNDLHYFALNVAMPEPDDLRTHFDTIEYLPDHIRKHLLEQRGIDWFHWYMLDMYRYQCRTSDENVSDIPLYTPLGAEMRKWHGQKVDKDHQIRLWIPNRHKWRDPIIEYGPQTEESKMPLCQLKGSPPEGLFLRWYPGMRDTTTITARQMLKSTMNRTVDAFILARNPSARILLVSSSEGQASDHLVTLKNILESDAWQTYFPTHKRGDRWSAASGLLDLAIGGKASKECNFTAIGAGSGKTGSHCDKVEFDDLEDENSSQGELMANAKKKFFEMIGQIGDAGSYTSIIGTIHIGDESGLMYPLLKEEVDGRKMRTNLVLCDSIDGNETSTFLKHPDQHIEKLRGLLPSEQFAQQWRCMVHTAGTHKFDVSNIQFVDDDTFGQWRHLKFDQIVMCTDPAYSANKSSDWTATVTMGRKWNEELQKDDLYVLFMAATKATETNQRKHYMRMLKWNYERYGEQNVTDWIEIGTLDESAFRKEARHSRWTNNNAPTLKISLRKFDRRGRKSQKHIDINRAAETIEEHNVYCPDRFFFKTNRGGKKNHMDKIKKVEQISKFRSQAAQFTGEKSNRKDDLLDAFSMCIDVLNIKTSNTKVNKPKPSNIISSRQQMGNRFSKHIQRKTNNELGFNLQKALGLTNRSEKKEPYFKKG